jgi:alpha-galactosidase
MVNAMLGRIHQSGFLPVLSPKSFAQVRNGISVYKQEIRSNIPTLTPFHPLGIPDVMAPTQPAALGMRGSVRSFMAVWRRDGRKSFQGGRWAPIIAN